MLKDIALLQKRELESRFQETYVERKIAIPWDLGNDLIKVITGPRRAGKSFYGGHLIRQTGSWGYINFDDERLTAVEDYDEIISAVNAIYDQPRLSSQPAAIHLVQGHRQAVQGQVGPGDRRSGPLSDVEHRARVFVQRTFRGNEVPQRPYGR
jgi:hypothetical protein